VTSGDAAHATDSLAPTWARPPQGNLPVRIVGGAVANDHTFALLCKASEVLNTLR
jgi:hypothetical protein